MKGKKQKRDGAAILPPADRDDRDAGNMRATGKGSVAEGIEAWRAGMAGDEAEKSAAQERIEDAATLAIIGALMLGADPRLE